MTVFFDVEEGEGTKGAFVHGGSVGERLGGVGDTTGDGVVGDGGDGALG